MSINSEVLVIVCRCWHYQPQKDMVTDQWVPVECLQRIELRCSKDRFKFSRDPHLTSHVSSTIQDSGFSPICKIATNTCFSPGNILTTVWICSSAHRWQRLNMIHFNMINWMGNEQLVCTVILIWQFAGFLFSARSHAIYPGLPYHAVSEFFLPRIRFCMDKRVAACLRASKK
jgi:hypothetical protein